MYKITIMTKKYFKIIVSSFIFVIIFFTNSFAAKINNIVIEGNDRISKETIIIFSDLNINEDIDANKINSTIKKLYETDYFKNIKIEINNDELLIVVEENPIIQSIKINGIKNKSILRTFQDIVKKSEKYPFLKINIQEQKNLLLNILRTNGFYFADVEIITQENNNNTINISYNFNIGERAKIDKIKFIGNNNIKDGKLRNIILSEEDKFWKFISKNLYLDIDRIQKDVNLLINYYKNIGYYKVQIKNSFAKLNNKEAFELVFNINEGEKYYFNDVKIILDDELNQENFLFYNKIFEDIKGKKYSSSFIKKIITQIDKTAIQKEYIFVNAKYEEFIVENNKINIDILFEKSEKTFIERINISGNYITEEKVLRNSLVIDEGDPFNKILFNKSINKLKSRNLFKDVKANIYTDPNDKLNKIININVEEKPTGEIFAGAGTGTNGNNIGAGIKENNYLGKGIKLDTNINISEEEIKGKFSVENPNYKNTDRNLKTTIESTSTDLLSDAGFKTTRTGLKLGTSFEQYEDLYVNLEISNYYEKLETSDLASALKKKQEGDYIENLFSYGITYNKLNQNYKPTDGFITKFNQTLPIYSDDWAIENRFDASKYYSLANDEIIFSASFFAKAINSLDDNVRVSKRVYIPSRKLRGFESGSIGPKDGKQYIGGNYGTAFNLNTNIPRLLNDFENIDFNIFFDAANLWNVDYDSSLDSNKIRSSAGLSIDWFTPVGPLSFSYAIPISEASTDTTESFRFQLGTTF